MEPGATNLGIAQRIFEILLNSQRPENGGCSGRRLHPEGFLINAVSLS